MITRNKMPLPQFCGQGVGHSLPHQGLQVIADTGRENRNLVLPRIRQGCLQVGLKCRVEVGTNTCRNRLRVAHGWQGLRRDNDRLRRMKHLGQGRQEPGHTAGGDRHY